MLSACSAENLTSRVLNRSERVVASMAVEISRLAQICKFAKLKNTSTVTCNLDNWRHRHANERLALAQRSRARSLKIRYFLNYVSSYYCCLNDTVENLKFVFEIPAYPGTLC